ncbi:DUF6000 family protein [Streptomyces sp. NPDC085479]|uniref:DUF6000 family protein n=1 Tax=Streptomyces sp. NPDC085479 TaxID=3365726 RepID=UPI0037CCD8E0
MSGPERDLHMRELAEAAREITPAELGILFEGGWRERRTASWLVAVAGRTEFRSRNRRTLVGPRSCERPCLLRHRCQRPLVRFVHGSSEAPRALDT